MKNKEVNTESKSLHTKGEWLMDTDKTYVSKYRIYETTTGANVGWFDIDDETKDEGDANAERIIKCVNSHDELFQMVVDLKNCIKRLSQDNLSQYERDTEAQWEGEAHDLLTNINPNYYSNANEALNKTTN